MLDLELRRAEIETKLLDVTLEHDHALLQVERLKAMLRDVLASAHPHRRDHPRMYLAWERAETLIRELEEPMPQESTSAQVQK